MAQRGFRVEIAASGFEELTISESTNGRLSC